MTPPPSLPPRIGDAPSASASHAPSPTPTPASMMAAALIAAEAASPFAIAEPARRRIRANLRQALTGRRRRPVWRTRYALVVGIALTCGGVVGASVRPLISTWVSRRWPDAATQPTPGQTAPEKVGRKRAKPEHRVATSEAALPSALPSTAPGEPSAPAVAESPRRLPRMAPPVVARVEPGVAPVRESALLADAIRTLRVGGDATSALTMLEQRAARFPGGALDPEGAALRIEALLRLGRQRDAVRDLDRLQIETLPRADQWRTVRGELRATDGRWSQAASDFDAVLAEPPGQASVAVIERALWGRAVARARTGNAAGARSDYAEYVRRFPGGRFAQEAERAATAPP